MIINWNLMKHPINWFIVLLMLLIAAYGGHLLLKYFDVVPAAAKDSELQDRNDISGFILGNENVGLGN